MSNGFNEFMATTLQKLNENWDSPLVPRKLVSKATGGVFSPKSLANMDSKGEGPKGAFRLGRDVVYPADEFFAWLVSRARPIEKNRR